MPKASLTALPWPSYAAPDFVPGPSSLELQNNLDRARQAMIARGLTHLLVYADREHFGNLHWLTGFDPRFEEALLIVHADEKILPLMLVGNECESYLSISELYRAGGIRHERYQWFSLLDQPREASRDLHDIFLSEGIGGPSRVGCIGWKYYADQSMVDIPSYIRDALRQRVVFEIVNATDMLMHAGHGLRTFANAREIAFSEYTNHLASEGMKRMMRVSVNPGATEFDLLSQVPYNGLPQSCYWGLKTGPRRVSLSSPRGLRIEPGYPISSNIAYWSSNCCRAGWTVSRESELPAAVSNYVNDFAAPYFAASAGWLERLCVGASGAELHEYIAHELPYEQFGVYLNAGHLIHNEEWLSSPIYAASGIALHSGMLLQSDIIPGSKIYGSSMRMEDTFALADEALLNRLQTQYPDCYARCLARSRYLQDGLGITLQPGVLPLSNLAGIVNPFWFDPSHTFVMRS
jgi:hypothetical protein